MNNKSANKQACKPTLPRNKLATTVAAALLVCAVQPAQANPVGGTVVNGQASFAASGNILTVTNTPGTIINWQGFSIGANEVTQFAQQTAASAVLNRVISNDPSNILGALQSNGRVFLINPNGILFGVGAKVDVAGLVASTLNLSNADFLAGRGNYNQVPGAQNISNAGHITAHGDGLEGGQIYLIAPNVENTGIITAANGEILLAAGHSVELVSTSNPSLRVNITAPAGDAINVGQLIASSGSLGLFGTIVRSSGTASANSATMQGGKIVFKASQRAEIAGTVSANGSTGGTIAVLGNQVGLMDGATVTANGAQGGGVVLVGGDYQGKNPDITNAQITYVAPTALISADGGVFSPTSSQGGVGNGGKVIVWADDTTRAYGNISAKGGMNGGFVETSGKRVLDAVGIRVNADAGAGGSQGQWLLDLSDITVIHSTAACTQTAGGVFNSATKTGTVSDANINAALNGGANVTIQTSACTTGGAGTIVVNGTADTGGAAVINNTAGLARTITFNTAGTINIHTGASIAGTANNPLNVTLNATGGNTIAGTINNSGGTTVLTGASTLSGTISNGMLTGAILTSNNGTLNGVTIGGNLALNGNIFIKNDLALASSAVLNIGASNVLFTSTGAQLISTAPAAAATINMAGGSIIAGSGVTGQSLQIGAGVTVQGYGSLTDINNAPITNAGKVISNMVAQAFTINPSAFTNNGTMTSAAGTLSISPATFTNNGTVNTAAGTTTLSAGNWTNAAGILQLGMGGTLNLGSSMSVASIGTINRNGGSINLTGTYNNTGLALDIGDTGLFMTGGLTSLSGAIVGGTLSNSNATPTLISSNGTLDSVTLGSNLLASGNLNIVNNLALLNGVTLTLGANNWLNFNTATANITTPASAAATITMAGGGLNRNVTGQVLTIGDGVMVNGTGSIQSATLNGTLVNNGAINTSATGGVVINHGTAINNGAMNVTTGTMNVGATTFTQAGTVNVASGTTFLRNGGFTNAGTLLGAGTIDVGATNTIVNNGIISLGGAGKVGTLTINGNLVMGAAGSVNIDLDAPQGGSFDVLNVSGTATLAGTLNLSGVGVVGAYPVLTTTGLGATRFATINSGTFTQTPTYTATNLTLNVTANTNPLTAFYWTGGAGTSNWADAANWSTGVVPIATSNLYIGPTAGTVTIAAGAQVGNALTCDASLALSGGSLTLTAASSVNGILTVSGGTLTSAIALSTPALNLTGGTLNGAGSLAVTTRYNQTSGALGNTFASINITQAAGNLTVGAMGATGAVNLTAPGNLTINGSITAASINAQANGITLGIASSTLNTSGATSTNAIILDAGAGKFINTGNVAFNVPNGRWLVYSSDPASDTFGGLASGNLPLWGKTYANYAPANVAEAGNRYLFSLVPALNVSAGAHTKLYGADLALSPPPGTITGLVNAAAYGNVFLQEATTGAVSITSPGFATNAGVTASPYAVNVAAGAFVPPAGYGATTYTNGLLKVNPASLIATANAQGKVYGVADPVLTYAASGFLLTDTAATVLTGALSRAAGENVGSYAIGQGTLAANPNYTINYIGSNLAITPATLMVAANAQSKVYGAADMALTYTASGFKFTDTTATILTGAFNRAGGENVGSYAIGQGTLATNPNYTINYTGSNLAITPATLMVTANAQSKVYGSPDMALTYIASGFEFTDTTATVLTGTLSRAGGENVGSYAIGQGTLAANPNYTLSYAGNNLAVTPAVLTVSANAASKIFSSPDPLLTYIVSGLQLNDTATTVLNGEPLSRAAGEMVGPYAINQGALGLITTNYTLNYAPGNFTILVPVMINEIVDSSNQNLGADGKTESRRREVLADTGIKGGDIAAQSLPICR